MNHETLKALYQLDVAEVGEEEAAKRWEYIDAMHTSFQQCIKAPSWGEFIQYRRKPGIPWPKVMQQKIGTCTCGYSAVLNTVHRADGPCFHYTEPEPSTQWPDDAPEWANAGLITWFTTSKELVVGDGQKLIERRKPGVPWPKVMLANDQRWRNAVLDQCCIAHTDFLDTDPKHTLDILISWHTAVALDPQVSSGAQALIDKGVAMQQPSIQWPDDAPEWADAGLITWFTTRFTTSKELVVGYGQKLIERPKPAIREVIVDNTTKEHCSTCDNKGKINGLSQETYCEQCVFQKTWRGDNYVLKPAKQKVDWAKLPLNVHRHMKQEVVEGEPLSDWIAWNCDEHTKGNPLPDGLVVEWYYKGAVNSSKCPVQVWNDVTRFRIVGIQEGWE